MKSFKRQKWGGGDNIHDPSACAFTSFFGPFRPKYRGVGIIGR